MLEFYGGSLIQFHIYGYDHYITTAVYPNDKPKLLFLNITAYWFNAVYLIKNTTLAAF